MPNQINFGMLAPDLQVQQQELARQQALIDALRQQSIAPMDSQMVTGAGPARAVPISPWQGIAKLGQAYLASNLQNENNLKQTDLNQQYNQRIGDALKRMAPPGTFDDVAPQAAAGQLGSGMMGDVALPQGTPLVPTQSTPQQIDPVVKQAWGRALAALPVNPDLANKLLENAATLTNEQKNNAAMGIDPQMMGRALLSKAVKEGRTEAQPGNTIYDSITLRPLVTTPDFKTGIQGGYAADGTPVMGAIKGSDVIANMAGAVAGATKAAELPYQSPTVINTPQGPRLMTPAQQISRANNGTSNQLFDALEQAYGLPKGLLAAQQTVESGGNPDAVNKQSGATGVAQFMPNTAKQYGIDPTNPMQSTIAQAAMMGDLLKKNGGDLNKALAQYGGFVTKDPTAYINKIRGNMTPGMELMSPEQAKVNEEKGAAVINAAKVTENSAPLFAAIEDARKLVKDLPYGMTTHLSAWASNQPVIGNKKESAAIAKWNNLMGNFTMNSIASSGLGRMDIPIVLAIEKAGTIPMDASPAAKNAALDQIEANLKRHIASVQNVVPNLNQPGAIQNTTISPMPSGFGRLPSVDQIQAEIARRSSLRK